MNPKTRDARLYKGMVMYLAGKYDEAMQIGDFKAEFVHRFKEDLLRRRNAHA